MPNIPENHHYCWSKKCSKCGIINRGCVRFNVFCYNCQEPLILFDTYSQSNLKELYISPEAIKDLEEWMPDIYTSGNTKLQDEKFLEQLSKNITIYESETILGPFTKAIVEKFNEINKRFY